jgi:hypothetical protein
MKQIIANGKLVLISKQYHLNDRMPKQYSATLISILASENPAGTGSDEASYHLHNYEGSMFYPMPKLHLSYESLHDLKILDNVSSK